MMRPITHVGSGPNLTIELRSSLLQYLMVFSRLLRQRRRLLFVTLADPLTSSRAVSTMRLPQFRVAMYLALLLGAACLFSPFGWGFTHPPLSGVNSLVSLGFFVLVTITGIRTMQVWWQARHVLRPLMLYLGAAFLATVVLLGGGSMSLQNTSAHYQWIDHMRVILIGLGILGGLALQEFVCEKVIVRTQRRLTEPQESGTHKP